MEGPDLPMERPTIRPSAYKEEKLTRAHCMLEVWVAKMMGI